MPGNDSFNGGDLNMTVSRAMTLMPMEEHAAELSVTIMFGLFNFSMLYTLNALLESDEPETKQKGSSEEAE
ncbi:hypothetical protein BDR04DRAFT_1106772, partial [Suillus decipiens]